MTDEWPGRGELRRCDSCGKVHLLTRHPATDTCDTCGGIGYTENLALEMPIQDCPDCKKRPVTNPKSDARCDGAS